MTQSASLGPAVRAQVVLRDAFADSVLAEACLTAFVADLRRGAIDYGKIRAAAPALKLLLSAGRIDAFDFESELLELTVDGATGPSSLLTEVPWEAAAWGTGALPNKATDLFAQLLASLAVCRLVPGATGDVAVADYRPRLIVCISNPPGIDGGQIAIGPIQTACDQALQLYPVFQVKSVRGRLTWSTVAPILSQFQPNVLIFVGHGSSNPQGGAPTLAFVKDGDPGGVDRVPVATIAGVLAGTRSCCLMTLIACDTARASGYSAACEFIRQGVEEVVAMQGSIQQQCARVILASTLGGVLAGLTLPVAVAAARRAADDHPHAILPAVFRSQHRSRSASKLGSLSALYRQALAPLYARVREIDATVQRAALQDSVVKLLAGHGIATVGGGYGNGGSIILRAAVASLLNETIAPTTRPIVYIDCDKRGGEEPLAGWAARELVTAISANAVLRPKSSPPRLASSASGVEIGTWAVEAEISVVLDNVPFHVTPDDRAFVEGLSEAYGRPEGRGVLVLGGAGELLQLAPEDATVKVGPLSLQETEAYAKQLMPGADAQSLYALTGGTLLLLDAERRIRMSPLGHSGTVSTGADIVDRYLSRMDGWLSASAREAAARLALFDYAVEIGLAEEYVTPDLHGAISELVSSGLALSFENGGATWILIPQRKSERIQRRTPDLEKIKETIARTFAERYDTEAADLVRSVASLGGAGTYLSRVQQYLSTAGFADIAATLPVDAQGTKLAALDLFRLFERAIEILTQLSTPDPDVLLAGVRAAINVGKAEQARAWLESLPSPLEPVDECRSFVLRASLLKDQEQAGALTKIVDYYKRAMDVAASMAPDEQAEFKSLRAEVIFDSLPTALFLSGEPAETAASRLAPVLAEVSAQERAQLLATLGEREMREPSDKINWSRVADWVTEAVSALDDTSDARVRTYCTYQQAQYLRLRPEPRFADAWRIYEQSRAAGQQAGEPRRAGLALCRLIELERDHNDLRQAPAVWPKNRLAQVDEVAADLWLAQPDALSMRALGRLQAVAADLDLTSDGSRDRLIQAAQAFSSKVLSARSDNRKFAEVCLRALKLDTGPMGDFLLAQRFLAAVRSEIGRRLGVEVDLEHPDAVRDAISGWLARPI